MTTIARLGHGTTFSFGSFAMEVTSISLSGEKEQLDVTHMESPDQFREFIGGLKNPGELSMEGNFDPDEPDPRDLDDDVFALTFPNGAVWEWPRATCTNYEPSVPVGEQMTVTASFQLSGSKTQTPGA